MTMIGRRREYFTGPSAHRVGSGAGHDVRRETPTTLDRVVIAADGF
jgi:hypothetical protein